MNFEKIEIPVNDGNVWVGRLTPNQLISISDHLWSTKRKLLIEDLKDAEVDSADRIVALSNHDAKRGLMSEVIGYAMNMEGAMHIIGVASKSEGIDDIAKDFNGSAQDAVSIAIFCIGCEVKTESDDSKSKKKQEKKNQSG